MLQFAQQYPYLNQHYSQEELEVHPHHEGHHHSPLSGLKHLQIVPSFGVHPWYTQREKDNKEWLDTLETLIQEQEHYGVG